MRGGPRAARTTLWRRGALLGLGVLVFVALWAGGAEACSVCNSATDETREAYYITTAIMMALPFILLGALVFWLVRASRRQSGAREAALPNPH